MRSISEFHSTLSHIKEKIINRTLKDLMKSINLKQVAECSASMTTDLFNKWCAIHGVRLKSKEPESVRSFIEGLCTLVQDPDEIYRITDACYLGYEIPQIGKEFDALWIGNQSIINIEFKSEPVPEAKILKQLLRNQYYLSSLGKSVKLFAFEAQTKVYYTLNEAGELVITDNKAVGKALKNFSTSNTPIEDSEMDYLFEPSKYLVSPFNSPQDFLDGKYFLNRQQEEIKNRILRSIAEDSGFMCYAIEGGAGTGKTLLLYDIVKELESNGVKTAVVHSGNLNAGHSQLVNTTQWTIKPSKDYTHYIKTKCVWDFNRAEVILIDEAQRCYHLEAIINAAKTQGLKCVISYDAVQRLHRNEFNNGNEKLIISVVNKQNHNTLSGKIRTNKNVENFINGLFDSRRECKSVSPAYIGVTYCTNEIECETIISNLKTKGYIVPRFTPNYHAYKRAHYENIVSMSGLSAHDVVGQEFDKVAAVVLPNMYYDANGKLTFRNGDYYDEERMLYQILTRARKNIHLVILNNEAILERCHQLLVHK